MKNKFKCNRFVQKIVSCKTTFLMLIFTFSSTYAISQSKGITINLKDVTIEQVLKSLQSKSDVNIFYNADDLKNQPKVSVNIKKGSVEDILKACLKNTSLSYKLVNKTFVIKKKERKAAVQKQTKGLLTQTIKGRIVDQITQVPLVGANVIVTTMPTLVGTITDADGYFLIEDIPVGRHNFKASFMGYADGYVTDLTVGSAKEVFIDMEMQESSSSLGEVVVKVDKRKPTNQMATVSARTFTVEETRRYAGGLDDASRMVSAFAGVTFGNLEDNSIVVRGNSPKGVLWRIDGVEVLNPNHFAGQQTAGGGFVSLFSSQLLSNSDFFTGAFPAEYGDVMSCVFDMKLREGNRDKREYTFQAGVMGADFSAEGPFVKGKNSSYLINYRYSTFQFLGPLIGVDAPPKFQDLSFKFNFPTKKAGTFSLWAIGGNDYLKRKALSDSTKWEQEDDRTTSIFKMNMGTVALNHKYSLSKNSFLTSTLSASASKTTIDDNRIDDNLNAYEYEDMYKSIGKYTFATKLTHRFSHKHVNRTGITLNNHFYNVKIQGVTEHLNPDSYQLFVNEKNDKLVGYCNFFTQSKFNLTNNIKANVGIHSTYFNLNDEYTIEPRAGLEWSFRGNQKLSLGYGMHSQLDEIYTYFSRYTDNDGNTKTNDHLRSSKAHHIVLGYNVNINENVVLKLEPYYQYLYDIPVIPNSYFSLINFVDDYQIEDKLVNKGTGENYGIELTLERFFSKNYYYLLTASIFDSKYKGGDKVRRNTKFNKRFVINGLWGKEFQVGKTKNNYIGLNGRIMFLGGEARSPINYELSNLQKEPVYDHTRAYSVQNKSSFMLDLSVTYRKNKPKYSSVWAFQVKNATASKYNTEVEYSYVKDRLIVESDNTVVPTISYKIEF